MKRQADRGARYHETVRKPKFPDLHRKQLPNLNPHGVSSVLDISQHCGNCHDGESNPEEDVEALKITMSAVGVEMRDSGGIFDGRENTSSLFSADVFPGTRDGLHRRRGILRDWGRAATTNVSVGSQKLESEFT